MPAVCNHGYWLAHCKLCAPLPGECDYGNCTDRATGMVEYMSANRGIVERRAMCNAHGRKSHISGDISTRYVEGL